MIDSRATLAGVRLFGIDSWAGSVSSARSKRVIVFRISGHEEY